MASPLDTGDSSQHEKIVQFTSLTGTDDERALFYLQAAAWNLDVQYM